MASGSLVPWLEDRISIQLHLAVIWLGDRLVDKRQNTQAHHKPGSQRAWSELYNFNGSCIDVVDELHPDSNCNLQIIKTDPLLLTDGAAVIETSLTSEAHHSLYSRTSESTLPHLPDSARPSLESPHGLIALRTYTIRYTSYGPTRDKLSFAISALDWQGKGHGRNLAGLRPISHCDKVEKALAELQDATSREDTRCFPSRLDDDQDMAGAAHRQDENRGGDGVSSHSQMAYGTQVDHSIRTRPEDSVQFLGTKSMEPILAANTRRQELSKDAIQSKSAQQVTKATLLSLINKSAPKDSPLTVPSAGGIAQPFPAIQSATMSRNHLGNNDQGNGGSGTFMTQNLPPPSQPSTPRRGDGVNSLKAPNKQTGQMAETNSSTLIEQHAASEQTSNDLPRSERGGDEPEWLKGMLPTRESAKPSSRQQSLLMKAECWHKPPPGHRFPDTNIPIEILEALGERAEADSAAAVSSPIVSVDEDDDIPEVGTDEEADITTSEVSWSRSPTPEPPKRPFKVGIDLPPDSSFEAGEESTDMSGEPKEETRDQEPYRPIVVGSSKEQTAVDPPSSLPLIQGGDESDCEMESEVPRGLGEDWVRTDPSSSSRFDKSSAHVQVEVTPYTKCKKVAFAPSGNFTGPAQQQTSSGASKDTSSTSIVFCTYNDTHTTEGGGSREANAQAEDLGRAQAALTKEEFNVKARSRSPDEMGQAPRTCHHTHPVPAEIPDVDMVDAPLHSPPLPPKLSGPQYDLSETNTQDHAISSLVPAALAPMSPTIRSVAPFDAQLKRKLEISPSKKSSRQSKRREIKIVKFGRDSPVRDTDAEIRRLRKESVNRTRESRQPDMGASNPTNRIEKSPLLPDIQRGADFEESLPTRNVSRELPSRSRNSTKLMVNDAEIPVKVDSRGKARFDQLSSGVSRDPSYLHQGHASHSEMHVAVPAQNVREMQNQHQEVSKYVSEAHPHSIPAHIAPPTFQGRQSSPVSSEPLTEYIAPVTVFQKFKNAYPEYSGNQQHFVNQCKQMYKLDSEDKMVPKWQWDDFIIRNRTDYRAYALQCADTGEDPEPYYRFYKDNIRDTLYSKGVIESRGVLLKALEELEAQPPTMEALAGSTPRPSRRSLPWISNQIPDITRKRDQRLEQEQEHKRRSFPTVPPHRPSNSSRVSASAYDEKTPHQPSNPNISITTSKRKGASTEDRAPNSERRSFNGSAFSRDRNVSRIPTESTGDQFRDFVFAYQRNTSFTGSTRIDPDKNWPMNLAIRPVAKIERKGYDILRWKDDL